MKVGFIGFAGSGKTTVFQAVTGIDTTPPPGSGGGGNKLKPNLGVTKVPDQRLNTLVDLCNSTRVVPTEIAFVDVPGGSPDRGTGGLQQAMIQHIGDMNALVLVVRAFDDLALGLPPADPAKELEAMMDELVLTDLVLIDKRYEKLKREHGNLAAEQHLRLLERVRTHLEEGTPLTEMALTPDEEKGLAGYRLLSTKPVIVIINIEEGASGDTDMVTKAQAVAGEWKLNTIVMSAKLEAEIASLEPEEQKEFLKELGLTDSARNRFIKTAYETLNLISFITVGPKEVRAWTINRGDTAVKAARAIHTDMERGFIRAEVMGYQDLVDLGSEAKARAAGKLRSEGKNYVVNDGDVIHFLFNV